MWSQKEEAQGELRCRERAAAFVRWLRARPEKVIAVVSHGHFLRHLFSLFPDSSAQQRAARRLQNAEVQEMQLCGGGG
jgi:broad specificity phosphatase PhoE